jgi:hypothetical protein
VRVEAAGRAVPSLIGFEDVGDAGDLYTPSPVGRPITAAWCDGVEVVHDGPLRAALRVRYRMRVPVALAKEDGEAFARPARRAGRPAELPLSVTLVLDAETDVLRVEVRGVNTARDHRLRVRLRHGRRAGPRARRRAFGPVERVPLDVPAEEQRAERVVRSAPLHRYVSLYAADRGATVYSDGPRRVRGRGRRRGVRDARARGGRAVAAGPAGAARARGLAHGHARGAGVRRVRRAVRGGRSTAADCGPRARSSSARPTTCCLPLAGGTWRALLDLPPDAGGSPWTARGSRSVRPRRRTTARGWCCGA